MDEDDSNNPLTARSAGGEPAVRPIAPAQAASKPDPAPQRISIGSIQSVPAISAIGLIAARMLLEHGIVTMMVSDEGFIEVVPAGELELDAWSEDDALHALIQHGYTDQQMADYLRQRASRKPKPVIVGCKGASED